MARDENHLARLYGRSAAPRELTSRVGPLLFVLLIVAMGLGAMLLALGALVGLSGAAQHGLVLREWGVLGEEEVITLLHDHSEAADGSSGCLVTSEGALLRWDEGRPTGRVTLGEAAIRRGEAAEVEIRGPEGTLVCPCRDEWDARWLADGLRLYIGARGPMLPARSPADVQ